MCRLNNIICVTDRKICQGDFLHRIEQVVRERPMAVILREKDLPEEEYTQLAKQVIMVGRRYGVPVILHTFVKVAKTLDCRAIHLPFSVVLKLSEEEKANFSILGASCHSVEEAIMAEKCGCTYLIAGHIFETACKQGLPGRGLGFLREVCDSVHIPVYAIGGIDTTTLPRVLQAGAKGGCMRSGLMSTK